MKTSNYLILIYFCFAVHIFGIDTTEVTNIEYNKCVIAGVCTPPHFDDSLGYCFDGHNWVRQIIGQDYRKDDVPVTCVDWFQAKKYCEWLGKRLPTESEWEKAARAGSQTTYYWGEVTDTTYLWYNKNSNMQIQSVAKKKPNRRGLYDMSGNVWEWCEDCFDKACTTRVFRGGSFVNDSSKVTSSARKGAPPASRYCNNGFRCISLTDKNF